MSKCCGCGKGVCSGVGDDISVRGVSGLHEDWCWKCAGYDYPHSRFKTSPFAEENSYYLLKDGQIANLRGAVQSGIQWREVK